MRAANAPAQAPKYVGVAFANAKDMTTCFGRSAADCYAIAYKSAQSSANSNFVANKMDFRRARPSCYASGSASFKSLEKLL